MNTHIDDSKHSLSLAVDELYDRAYKIADAHWSFVNAMGQQRTGWQARSDLQLTCSKRNNALIIHWTHIEWVGTASKRFMKRNTIKRNADGSYPLKTLKKVARDWEFEMVVETDRKLQEIRRVAGHINKCLLNIRNTEQLIKKLESQTNI